MLTVYGIETAELSIGRNATSSVATVLTVYGIETLKSIHAYCFLRVATVLTVYGIETYSRIL